MARISDERRTIIIHRFGIPIQIVMQRLQQLKEDALQEHTRLISVYKGWMLDKDARLKALSNFFTVIERTQFQILIVAKLADDEWCEANLDNEVQQPEGFKNILIARVESSTKYSLGMSMFTLIENYFRIALRSLDPVVCNNSTGPFENIYTCLLGSSQLNLPQNDKAAALAMLNFIRLIRNLIHNDGVYYSKDGQDTFETYKGVRYDFYNGKPVGFVTWNLLLDLIQDVLQLLKRVINDGKIATQNQIIDPFAAHNW